MIARHETDKSDIWAKLAAALPQGAIEWRQAGKAQARDGKHFARFVGYIEANTVRERLDSVVPGEWDLALSEMPAMKDHEGEDAVYMKARLAILGVVREDVGCGQDWKAAATDAFKRAGVRFGIGHELYALNVNWVQVDGDGKYAKPLEDPQAAYTRRYGGNGATPPQAKAEAPVRVVGTHDEARSEAAVERAASAPDQYEPDGVTAEAGVSCPKCGGRVWDNRATKKNPKAPDFKCRDRSCDGVIWPPRETKAAPRQASSAKQPVSMGADDVGF